MSHNAAIGVAEKTIYLTEEQSSIRIGEEDRQEGGTGYWGRYTELCGFLALGR